MLLNIPELAKDQGGLYLVNLNKAETIEVSDTGVIEITFSMQLEPITTDDFEIDQVYDGTNSYMEIYDSSSLYKKVMNWIKAQQI